MNSSVTAGKLKLCITTLIELLNDQRFPNLGANCNLIFVWQSLWKRRRYFNNLDAVANN